MFRTIGTLTRRNLDPFLMLDQFNTNDPDDYIAGFPDHPPRRQWHPGSRPGRYSLGSPRIQAGPATLKLTEMSAGFGPADMTIPHYLFKGERT